MPTELPCTTYIAVLMLAFLSVLTTLLGVALAIYVGKSERLVSAGIGFSAGIMLLVSFFELVPEAVGETGMGTTLAAVTLGMLIVASLHWLIPHTHLVEERGAFRQTLLRTAYLVHSASSCTTCPRGSPWPMLTSLHSLGVLVALAIAIHNIPEEFAMAVPIVMVKKRRFLYMGSIPVRARRAAGGRCRARSGALPSPLFMAFAAGAMIFISVHELLPMAKEVPQYTAVYPGCDYKRVRLRAAGRGGSRIISEDISH